MNPVLALNSGNVNIVVEFSSQAGGQGAPPERDKISSLTTRHPTPDMILLSKQSHDIEFPILKKQGQRRIIISFLGEDQKIGKMDRHCREKNVQSLVGIYYLHRSELPLGEKIVITERACHILGRFHIKGWTQKKKLPNITKTIAG